MKTTLAWVLLLFMAPAQADLFRWIDPDTGSVKISNLPPSDERVSAEVVPFKPPPPPPKPAASVVTKPAAAPTAASAVELEGRWRALLAQLTGLTPQDFNKGGEGLVQHMQAYEAVRQELDRVDPSGAARRNAEQTTVFERLKQGLAAQFSTKPPAQR